MKNVLLFLFSLVLISPVMAQLKAKVKCPDLEVDILEGKVNGIKPDVVHERVKLLLPCYTSVADQKDSSKCGTAIFYKDKDIKFYTDRQYVEIGPKFKGKLSFPLMGAPRSQLFKVFGNPKIKDDTWEAYQTTYGTLVLYFDAANKVKLIQMATKGVDDLKLCE